MTEPQTTLMPTPIPSSTIKETDPKLRPLYEPAGATHDASGVAEYVYEKWQELWEKDHPESCFLVFVSIISNFISSIDTFEKEDIDFIIKKIKSFYPDKWEQAYQVQPTDWKGEYNKIVWKAFQKLNKKYRSISRVNSYLWSVAAASLSPTLLKHQMIKKPNTAMKLVDNCECIISETNNHNLLSFTKLTTRINWRK